MRVGRFTLIAVMGLSLAAYAFDCLPMTTSDEAMDCCNSMDCAGQGHHGEDCCQTAPSTHSPFTQAASVHPFTCAHFVFAVLPACDQPAVINSRAGSVNLRS